MRRVAAAVAPASALMAAAALFAVGALFAAGPAWAQGELVELTPADGTVVDAPPAAVIARFDVELDPAAGFIEVVDDSGAVVARGGVDRDDPDNTSMLVGLPGSAQRGAYTVRWEVHVASDGQVITGDAGFAVGSVEELTALDDGNSGPGGSLSSIAVAVVLAVIAAAIVAVRLRSPPPSSGGRPDEDAEVLA